MAETAETQAPKKKKQDLPKLWRLGVKKNAPFHFMTVGGQQFVRSSEHVTGYNQDTKRREIRGTEVSLTDKQVLKIKEDAKAKFVRVTTGKKARSRIYTKNDPFYTPMPGDQPVTKWLYIEKVSVSEFKEPEVITLNEE